MLSEETLVLYAVAGACVLLVLGVLELLSPTRSRHPRRRGATRDPMRRARAAPAPSPVSERAGPGPSPVPERTAPAPSPVAERAAPGPSPTPERAAAAPARPDRPVVPLAPRSQAPPVPPPLPSEPPIERLLLAQAESTTASGPTPSWARARTLDEPRPPASVPPGPSTPGPSTSGPSTPAPPEPVLWDDPEPVVGSADEAPLERPMTPPVPPPQAAPPAAAAVPAPVPPSPSPPPPPTPPEREVVMPAAATHAGPSLVDRCYELYEAGRLRDAITEATAALDSVSTGALFMEPAETARLWGITGLARQALGERDGARAAFEEAMAVAPRQDRVTWQQHLGALAREVGSELMTLAQSGTADAEERVTTLHGALTWLEGAAAAAPDDQALQESAAAARRTLWPTYEHAVGELLQRQDFQVARRLLRQALGEDDCPNELQAAFREMLSTTYSGEVGQLTAEAIKRMQEGREEEALTTLDRAEAVLGAVPEGALVAKRRHELERRLWWSYTKVGLRRVEGGLHEEALPPLLHALGYESVGPERREETKAPLVRALEAIVTARSPLIQRMTADGDREGALLLCDKLWSFLRTALERGLTREELSQALTRTQTLFEKLGKFQR